MTRSIVTLAVFAVVVSGSLVFEAGSPVNADPRTEGSGDIAAFQAVIARVRSGEPYYAAFGDELRRRGYPLRQVFNWRTPLTIMAAASAPDLAARGLMLGLGLMLCVLTMTTLQPALTAAGATVMQLGTMLMIAVPSAAVMGEAWSGLCIGLSICAYVGGHRSAAIATGLLALFFRELAAPYCLACVGLAVAERRWREVAAWLGGGCVYAAYFAWHVSQVVAHQQPADLSHAASWLQFGGLPFLMATVRWQGWLMNLPIACAGVALGLIASAIVRPRVPGHIRATSVVYVAFFLVAGQGFNDYWGLVAWPAWALATGAGVQGVWDSASEVLQSPSRK